MRARTFTLLQVLTTSYCLWTDRIIPTEQNQKNQTLYGLQAGMNVSDSFSISERIESSFFFHENLKYYIFKCNYTSTFHVSYMWNVHETEH